MADVEKGMKKAASLLQTILSHGFSGELVAQEPEANPHLAF